MIDRYSFPDHRIRLDYLMEAIHRLDLMAEFGISSVADLGCGSTPIQGMPFKRYIGIDNDPKEVPKFDRPGYDLILADYEGSLDTLDLEEVDLVIWSEGPEHTLKHDRIFNNIRKLLKPEGFLMLTCPNEEAKIHGEDLEHKRSFDLPALRKLVEENGFTVLEIAEVYSRIHPELLGYNWLYCLATNAEKDPRYKGAW